MAKNFRQTINLRQGWKSSPNFQIVSFAPFPGLPSENELLNSVI